MGARVIDTENKLELVDHTLFTKKIYFFAGSQCTFCSKISLFPPAFVWINHRYGRSENIK